MRRERQNHLRRHPLGFERADEITDDGQIPDPRNRDARPTVFLLKQAAEHDGFAIPDVQHRLSRSIAEFELGYGWIRLKGDLLAEANDFDFHLERQFVTQMNRGLDRQFDSGIAKFDGRHR